MGRCQKITNEELCNTVHPELASITTTVIVFSLTLLLLSLFCYYLVCFMAVFTTNKDVYKTKFTQNKCNFSDFSDFIFFFGVM